jgi:RNA polymerase sigma factor (TIGR02999 family)
VPEHDGRSDAPAGEVTRLLAAARDGEAGAAERLFELVYDDLREIAARHVRTQRQGPSSTSLVHEVFLRVARRGELAFNDRTHFFAVCSRAMRQVVIDEARARGAAKRGGPVAPAPLESVVIAAPASEAAPEELLALDGALSELEAAQPRLGRVVEWHFFGGLTFAEIGEALGVTERTVLRDWRAARALLHDRLAAES